MSSIVELGVCTIVCNLLGKGQVTGEGCIQVVAQRVIEREREEEQEEERERAGEVLCREKDDNTKHN